MPEHNSHAATGIAGLDEVLGGGLPRGGFYLIQGGTGSGKTVAALQAIREAEGRGERCLFLTLSQSEDSIRRAAGSFGWSLDGVCVHQLSRRRAREHLEQRQVIFGRNELEADELMHDLLAKVDEIEPDVVVFDAVSHLRVLADSETTYRLELLAIRDFFADRKTTVLLTNNPEVAPGSDELADLSTGVIDLSSKLDAFGTERRSIAVRKVRGHGYKSGVHDMVITGHGIEVAPRLASITAKPENDDEPQAISSGDKNIDELLGGGLLTGTSTLVVGPSGSGKTTACSLYAIQAAEHHGGALCYLFDETVRTFTMRCDALQLPASRLIEEGSLRVRHVPTAALSPGGFAQLIRQDLDESGARMVLIDSLTGYLSAMTDAKMLETQMHDLLMYMNDRNVLGMLVVAQHGLFGSKVRDPVDVSYLADTVVLLRHFAFQGELRRSISVFKKRYGAHESSIRELTINARDGVTASRPLVDFDDVLSGTPRAVEKNNGSTQKQS